jgi:hypothetical protein
MDEPISNPKDPSANSPDDYTDDTAREKITGRNPVSIDGVEEETVPKPVDPTIIPPDSSGAESFSGHMPHPEADDDLESVAQRHGLIEDDENEQTIKPLNTAEEFVQRSSNED